MLRACDNPFSSDRVLRLRYRLDETGWAKLLRRWHELGRKGAIIGRKGSGKTTLLEDFGARLRICGWTPFEVRLHSDTRTLPGRFAEAAPHFDEHTVVLLDGAEQLSSWAWWRFRWTSRRAGGLVVSAHHSGRLPTLHKCVTRPALLVQLAAELGRTVSAAEAHTLFERHEGNLREALRTLYNQAAAQP